MKIIMIIGAGPAGIFAALNAKNENNKVILLERNSKIARKLAITGKGRCNITNSRDISDFFTEFNRNPYFCYSSLYSYTNQDLIDYFEANNLKLKIERGGRVFPVSDNSFDVIDTLSRDLTKKNIEIIFDTYVDSIDKREKFYIRTSKGNFKADSLVIATGGRSYPATGSDGSGYGLAKQLGHNINSIQPALVPLELGDAWLSDLAGVTLKNITLKLYKDKKLIQEEFGELLFTHSGISGPTTLRMSSFMDDSSKYKLSIDLKPALSIEELDKRIQIDFQKYNNKAFKNSLKDLTISSLIPIIINLTKIKEDKPVHQITREERTRLVKIFKDFPLNYKAMKSVEYGIVTRGGVDVEEVNPSTMESKLVKDLYFAGEVLDVDANTGGFNLQFAFSTGYLAGVNAGRCR